MLVLLRSFLLLAFVLLVQTTQIFAYQNGITGRTTSGCGGSGCHSGTPSNTTLTVSGTTTLTPGQQSTLTLTIQNSSRPRSGCDIDFINSGGSTISGLSTISGQGMSGSSEIYHSTPKSMSGGQSTFQFNVTGPSTPGLYTIRIAGNATTSSNSGDYTTTTKDIIVKGLTLTAPTGGTYCGGGVIGLQWTSYGVANINILLSTDGGSTYNQVGSTSSNNGSNSYNYTLPANTPQGSTYRLKIADATDANLSSAMSANFSVSAGLSITTQPAPATQTVCQGSNVVYNVAATGAGLTYQWRKDGTPLTGATASQLTLNNVAPSNAGVYDCVVSSTCGAPVNSNTVTLSIDPAASITAQPQGQTVCEGSSFTASVTATGGGLTYKWQKNGTAITGATASSYSISNTAASDAATYTCVVTGACGAPATSQGAVLVVVSNPTFTTHPASVLKCEGTSVTFTAAVSNGNGLNYEWVKDGVTLAANARITGVNTLSLTINPVQSSDVGNYQLRANAVVCASNALSNTAILGVNTAPPITTQPQPKVTSVGGSVTFSVTATGTGLTYQWRKNASALSGQTNSSYTITSAAKSDEGSYSVVVTNTCGSTTSTNASLTVSDLPQPAVSLNVAKLNFGTAKVGASIKASFEITNSGTAKLDVSALTISGAASSSFSANAGAFSLDPAAKKTVEVTFVAASGTQLAKLSVASNATGTNELDLEGSGVARALNPGLVEIKDTVNVGSSRDTVMTICNTTTNDVVVTEVLPTGEVESYGFIGVPITSLLPLTLKKDSCVKVAIRFNPTHEGVLDMRVLIKHTQGADTLMVVGYGKTSTSISWEDDAQFSVQPNPAYSEATVVLPWNDQREVLVRLVDILGNVVYEQRGVSPVQRLNLNALSSGSYRILVEGAQKHVARSLVIVR